jgi:F-type H+-transporting ATPase subunit delta
MAAGSLRSRTELLGDIEKTIDESSSARLGNELFAVVDVLDHEPALRRALTEPAVPPESKFEMLDSLVGGKIARPAMDVLKTAVTKRWSRSSDLADGLEEVAITAVASSADEAGKLDDVEDELFRFGRILDAEPHLREALADAGASVEGKRELLDHLLGRKVGKVTRTLLDQLVVGRHRTLARGLAHYQEVLAARNERLLATAWVAKPLSEANKGRLTKALTAMYDQPVHLNIVIDTDVLGGVRVMVGDDLIDSSIETRLADAHRRIIG